MSEFKLQVRAPLGGFAQSFDGVELREVPDLAIVSMALPLGGEDAALRAIAEAFGVAAPDVGRVAPSGDGATRLARLGRDQFFAMFAHPTPDAGALIAEKLGGAVYVTDQTDVWVALDISGPRARAALERICPIDLHPLAFGPDAMARTAMEHLGTLVIRAGEDGFLLLSASSSAESFLHALTTSIGNIGAGGAQ